MTLRLRLIILIAAMLSCSLAAGGVLAWRHAVRSVRTEMAAALGVGQQTVQTMLSLSGVVPDHPVGLVRAFDGDRHVRALLVAPDGTMIASSRFQLSKHPPPSWFIKRFTGTGGTARIALPSGDSVVIETDAHNEIGEVWTSFRDALAILALFCTLTTGFIYWGAGWSLRPLLRLAEGLGAIGRGDYAMRLRPAGPPELAGLTRDFNRMAGLLAELRQRNDRLTQQMTTLQEEERADLARDLHDDVGPFLFAATVDAAMIARQIDPSTPEIGQRVTAIQESIGHAQARVRDILRRLRPSALSDVGLTQATRNLVQFWQHRHPDIAINLDIAVPERGIGTELDAAAYRIIQESLNNAIRHADPSRIDIAVTMDEDALRITVLDDGEGFDMSRSRPDGYGLVSMRERVAALDGVFSIGASDGSKGTRLTAELPLTMEPAFS
jgi:two-component system sensor histidine kinase UhpB